jgi:hypothetical protein
MGSAVPGAEAVGKQEPLIYHRNLLRAMHRLHQERLRFCAADEKFCAKVCALAPPAPALWALGSSAGQVAWNAPPALHC